MIHMEHIFQPRSISRTVDKNSELDPNTLVFRHVKSQKFSPNLVKFDAKEVSKTEKRRRLGFYYKSCEHRDQWRESFSE